MNMRRILERPVEHFQDLYSDSNEAFLEDERRKYFLLYLKPILYGSGNYYLESHTRGFRCTDVIIDYHGEQYMIKLKIWCREEYHNRSQQQLIGGKTLIDFASQKTPLTPESCSHGMRSSAYS